VLLLPPSAALAPYVVGFRMGGFSAPLGDGGGATELVSMPSASLELVFGTSSCMTDHPRSGHEVPKPAEFVFGPMQTERGATLRIGARESVRLVSVLFRPGAGALLLGEALDGLSDRVFPAGDVLPRALRGWAGGALLDASPEEAKRRLEAELLSHVSRLSASRRTLDPRIARAHAFLRSGRGTVADVARAAGLSERQLERAFRVWFGMTPKRVAQLARFDRAASALVRGPGNLARLAQELGYADHAHFTREFRAIAGVPPSRYAEKRARAIYLPA
jgi:AraC-like DNA-binding protein